MRLVLYRGKWAASWREGGRTKRMSLGTSDRGEAERALADLEKTPSADTVKGVLDAYIADKQEKAGIAGIRDAEKSLTRHLGYLRPDQVDRATCRDYAAKRDKVSVGTRIKELSVLRAALRWAGFRPQMWIPPAPPARAVWITKEQFERLLDAAPLPHIKAFLTLAWYTAARRGAILGLRWDDVDLPGRRIDFGGGRGNKGRAVARIPDKLLSWLEQAHRDATSQFVVEWGGRRVASIRKGFAATAVAAGLDGIRPHDIRRSAARHLVEQGEPLNAIAQLLGHTNVATTYKVYAKFGPDYMKGVVDKL